MTPESIFFLSLIVFRLTAIIILIRIIRIQLRWINVHDSEEYSRTRKAMFGLTSLAVLASTIPLVMDVLIAIHSIPLTNLSLMLVLSSNAIGDLLQAVLICKLYKED